LGNGMSEPFWRPQVMRHRRRDGSVEFAMHDVYFNENGEVSGYTVQARSPRFPTVEGLQSWLEVKIEDGAGVVCGDLGSEHSSDDFELWLNHVTEEPIAYEEVSNV
jgi:hypothetical protein